MPENSDFFGTFVLPKQNGFCSKMYNFGIFLIIELNDPTRFTSIEFYEQAAPLWLSAPLMIPVEMVDIEDFNFPKQFRAKE